jgi:hypothetical protein
MRAIADEAERLGLAGYAEYCRLRESGLRSQAFAALARFITFAAALPDRERRALSDWLMSTREQHNRVDEVLPHPLKVNVVEPTLEAWRNDTRDAAPRRWLGILHHDRDLLDDAIACDATDDIARRHLIRLLLDHVAFSTHHLSEGLYLGDIPTDFAFLDKAKHELQQLRDPERRDRAAHRETAQRQLLEDWQTYSRSKPDEPFRDWCTRQGKQHGWAGIYYYEK